MNRRLQVTERESIPALLWSFLCELLARFFAGFKDFLQELIACVASVREANAEA